MTNQQRSAGASCATAILAVPAGDVCRARPARPWHTGGPVPARGKWTLGFSLVVGSWSLALHLRIRTATTRAS